MNNLKEYLDKLVIKYEIPEFIKDDPVQFCHKYTNKKDIEIAGIIASCLAYGKRQKIIESCNTVLSFMDFEPYKYIINLDADDAKSKLAPFKHRYTSGEDIFYLLLILNRALQDYENIEDIFLKGYNPKNKNIKLALTHLVSILTDYLQGEVENMRGINFLLPNPQRGSACKRLNMFLRWMVRKGPVDLNLWQNVSSSKLLIPLDTHVAKVSRKLGICHRQSDDWITAEEITDYLLELDPDDPAKYDFAIFGEGIYNS